MEVAPALGRALMKATGTSDFNVIQNNGKNAGQEVFHVHFHVIPRSAGDIMSDSWARWDVSARPKLAKRDADMILRSIEEFYPQEASDSASKTDC